MFKIINVVNKYFILSYVLRIRVDLLLIYLQQHSDLFSSFVFNNRIKNNRNNSMNSLVENYEASTY